MQEELQEYPLELQVGLERHLIMPTLEVFNLALNQKEVPICLDMQPILPHLIAEQDTLLLVRCLKQDSIVLEYQEKMDLSTLITTLIKRIPLFSHTRTVGNTLNE